MILIIAEKPALGKAIAGALPGTATSKDSCIYKGDYVVTWLFGHMLSLKEPEDYNKAYKKWSLDSLPIFFENWQTKISNDSMGKISKRDRVNQIGQLLKSADMVIHAGDPDDEGQLLVDEILNWFNYKGPVKRLDTANTTEEALRKALNNMKDNSLYVNSGQAAYARSVADLMVGVNMSRFFTCNNSKVLLTVGRVQTPTLGLVVNRDYQIEHHVKRTYYNVMVDLKVNDSAVTAKFVPAKDNPYVEEGKIFNIDYAQTLVKYFTGKTFDAVVTKKRLEEAPPLPFNLVKLQSYCGKKFGYSPSEVLSITQSLRETHNAITYNRSDCQYLSEEHFKEAPATLNQVMENIHFRPSEIDPKIKSRCFNSENITAHFAIIPTNHKVQLDRLTQKEKNVYLAVCKFYMIQFMPKAVKEKTELKVDLAKGNSLKASSSVVLSPGYLSIYNDDKEKNKKEENILSEIPAGTYSSPVLQASVKNEELKPPPRYTKTSLNEDMTRIAKYVEDPEVKKLLLTKDKDKKGENGSIGTSATRSGIIDQLTARGYLREEKKSLISTALGRELYRILPDEIKKADMTAKWWTFQEDIAAGNKTHKELTDNVLETIRSIISKEYPKIDQSVIKSQPSKRDKELGKCPRCGGDIRESKNSFFCSNWKEPASCKFTIWKKPLSPLFSKTRITPSNVRTWLSGKPVKKKNLYSSKKNTTFTAYVAMNDDGKSQYGPSFELVSDTKKDA